MTVSMEGGRNKLKPGFPIENIGNDPIGIG